MSILPPVLIHQKQNPPPLAPNTVSRPRLLERLDKTLHKNAKLTLVSAPAGSGKTTLLIQWCALLEKGQIPFAWLTLEDADNDPIRFCSYFHAIIEKVPGFKESTLSCADLPEYPPQGGNGNKPEALIDALHSLPISSPFYFILDDYHWIKVEPVHTILTYLLNHLPPWAHLVIASRSDPPLGISRLRSHGRLVEIRSEDLNFTEEEVSEFVEQNIPTGLSFEQNTSLAKRTEGWITGIKLTALSVQKIATNHPANDPSQYINDFGGDDRHVMDYLSEEVFGSQPDLVREFLLKTSIMKRMNDSLCEAVIKNGNGHYGNRANGRFSTCREILEYLDLNNLFVIPLDTRRSWYRYHGLFRGFLRWQLQKSAPDEEIARLYQQASLWSEENELIAEAIEYALAGKDYPRVIYLLDQYGLHLLAEAPISFDRRWIEALPKHLAESNPIIHVLPVVSQLARGETLNEKTEAHLKAAELYLSQKGKAKNTSNTDRHTAYLGHLAMIRASQGILRGDDPYKVIELGKQALRELTEDAALSRHYVLMVLFTAHMMLGELDLAALDMNEARQIVKFTKGTSGMYQNIFSQATIAHHRGMLNEAVSLCEEILREDIHHLEANETSGVSHHLVSLMLRQVYLQQNNVKEAVAAAQRDKQGRWIKQQSLFSEWAFTILARLPAGFRNTEESEFIQSMATKNPEARRYLAACQARAVLTEMNYGADQRPYQQADKVDEVVQWAKSVRLEPADSGRFVSLILSGEWRYFEQLTLARALIAQRRMSGKQDLKALIKNLDALLKTIEKRGLQDRSIEILIVLALAYCAEGERKNAFTALIRALRLAQPGGYVRVFLDEGETMRRMLEQLDDPQRLIVENQVEPDDILRDTIHMLTAAFAEEHVNWGVMKDCATREESASKPATGLLSEREIEIITLLATGLSKAEIASQLFLSQNTIKAHTRTIYSKLGIHSKDEVILRARELGLTA